MNADSSSIVLPPLKEAGSSLNGGADWENVDMSLYTESWDTDFCQEFHYSNGKSPFKLFLQQESFVKQSVSNEIKTFATICSAISNFDVFWIFSLHSYLSKQRYDNCYLIMHHYILFVFWNIYMLVWWDDLQLLQGCLLGQLTLTDS